MAVKQYIGARYVPLMDGPYDPAKEYEPLTTVSYGQATYTSRKKVPVGVLPTNSEYWMYIPSGSQSVAELEEWKTQTVEPFIQQTASDVSGLQADVSGLQDDVSGLQGDVSTAQSNISSLQGDVSTAQSNISGLLSTTQSLQNQINALDLTVDRKYVIIGDSYSVGTTSGSVVTGYPEFVRQYLGLTNGTNFFHKGQNGAGFVNTPTFISLLNSLSNEMTGVDFNTITDVVVIGGLNDVPHVGEGITTAANSFVARAKQLFPNAKVHVGVCGYSISPTVEQREASIICNDQIEHYYLKANGVSQIRYLSNTIAADIGMMDTGGNMNHPIEKGQKAIARGLVSYLLGGAVNYGHDGSTASLKPTITLASGVSMSGGSTIHAYEQKKNGLYSLHIIGINCYVSNVTDTSRIPLFTMSNNIGHGYRTPFTAASVTGCVTVGSGRFVPFAGRIFLEGNTVCLESCTLNAEGTGFLPADSHLGFFIPDIKVDFPVNWC